MLVEEWGNYVTKLEQDGTTLNKNIFQSYLYI